MDKGRRKRIGRQNSEMGKRVRREAAALRTTEVAAMTPQQRLERLDDRLGAGQGARKERLKLLAKIEAAQMPVAAPKKPAPDPTAIGVVVGEGDVHGNVRGGRSRGGRSRS